MIDELAGRLVRCLIDHCSLALAGWAAYAIPASNLDTRDALTHSPARLLAARSAHSPGEPPGHDPSLRWRRRQQ